MNVGCPHQPGDLITADLIAGSPRRLPQFVRAVDAVVGRRDRDQIGIITASRTARADKARDFTA
jgi:hypothetical protein